MVYRQQRHLEIRLHCSSSHILANQTLIDYTYHVVFSGSFSDYLKKTFEVCKNLELVKVLYEKLDKVKIPVQMKHH